MFFLDVCDLCYNCLCYCACEIISVTNIAEPRGIHGVIVENSRG